MAVSLKVLIPAQTLANTQTSLYGASGLTAIIDKFTATNYSATAATISVNILNPAGSAGNDNLIVKTKTLQAGETYTFPELVGHMVAPGGSISALAGTASAINVRASGREVS